MSNEKTGAVSDLMAKEDVRHKLSPAEILLLPRINLTSRQLCDLELLLNGAFYPLTGFMNEKDYDSVVRTMRLSNGTLWPMPIVLDVYDQKVVTKGKRVVLADEYGMPLAVMDVTSVFKPDKRREAREIYQTTSIEHPGVDYLFHRTGAWYAGGTVHSLSAVSHFDFVEYRQSPQEIRRLFTKNHWSRVIGFQTRNPLHRAHTAMLELASKEHSANILLHPTVGATKEGDIDYITRVRCYIKLLRHIRAPIKLSLIPLAMRMAGPREAMWHALVRKNYGCTHFIIGRDHAGPTSSSGKSFYGLYDAQKLAQEYEGEMGIVIIPFKEMVYVPKMRQFMPIDRIKNNKSVIRVSGTSLRNMISKNKKIPSWYSYDDIIGEIKRGMIRDRNRGVTIFFTGLPSAGKSTIARMLYFKLLETQNRKVTLLDGDVVRQNLSKGLGFSRQDRIANIERIGFVAAQITKHNGIAICSAVSPYEEARQKNRALISLFGRYIEVYVSTPLSVCKKRDVKGLYKQVELGMLKGLTGVDDPYEKPEKCEITIDTTKKTASVSVAKIYMYLLRHKIIDVIQ